MGRRADADRPASRDDRCRGHLVLTRAGCACVRPHALRRVVAEITSLACACVMEGVTKSGVGGKQTYLRMDGSPNETRAFLCAQACRMCGTTVPTERSGHWLVSV